MPSASASRINGPAPDLFRCGWFPASTPPTALPASKPKAAPTAAPPPTRGSDDVPVIRSTVSVIDQAEPESLTPLPSRNRGKNRNACSARGIRVPLLNRFSEYPANDACPERSRRACPERSRRACPERSRRAVRFAHHSLRAATKPGQGNSRSRRSKYANPTAKPAGCG
jgi:hypothetical protein